MSRINKLLDDSKAFDRRVQEHHSLKVKKDKWVVLSEQETKKKSDFIEKFMPYLSKEDREKGRLLSYNTKKKTNILIEDNASNLDISKTEDFKKAIELFELLHKTNYKAMNQVTEMLKSTFEKRASNNTITQAEIDSFNILLIKRNIEKK